MLRSSRESMPISATSGCAGLAPAKAVPRGVEVLKAVSGHAIMLDPPMWFGPGEPLLAGRGDLLLAHFLLGHNIGGNTSADTRRILYYRLAAEGHAARWADTFLDPFTEYPSLREIAPTEPFVPLSRTVSS